MPNPLDPLGPIVSQSEILAAYRASIAEVAATIGLPRRRHGYIYRRMARAKGARAWARDRWAALESAASVAIDDTESIPLETMRAYREALLTHVPPCERESKGQEG